MSETERGPAQSLLAHLTELRSRLLRCAAAIGLVLPILLYFSSELYSFASLPLRKLLPEGSSMIATEVASPFLAPFKLSLALTVFVVMPYLLYQAWAFIAPALYRPEKQFALPLLISSVLLFYAGMAFAYWAVFPLVFGFFANIGPASVKVMTDISHYLSFILKMFFAFGIAFEIPVAVVLLIRAGLVEATTIAQARPYVIIGCFVAGMLLTPPDVLSQLLLAGPAWLLFEIGLLIGRQFEKRSGSTPDPEEAEPPPEFKRP